MSAAQFFLPYRIAAKPTNVGAPGAQMFVYAAGTTTKRAVYTSAALTTQLGNPVVADGAGKFADVWLDNSLTYKLVIKDKNGATLDTFDNYIPATAPDSTTLAPYQAAAEAAATNASGYSTAASTSATSAASSASNAAVSATSASSSATAATATQAAILAAIAGTTVTSASLNAASRTLLASVSHASLLPVVLTESGYGGIFLPTNSSVATAVSNDPDKVSTVPYSTDTTGASGGYQRISLYNGRLGRVFAHCLPMGGVTLPGVFNNTLGVVPFWDGSAVQYRSSPYDLVDFTLFTTCNNYYVSYSSGNDANAGTSSGTAWKTLTYAIANAVSPAIINLLDDTVGVGGWDSSSEQAFNGKLKIKGKSTRTRINGRREAENAATFAWAASGSNGAYVSTVGRAALIRYAHFDANYKDNHGIPRPLTLAASQVACEATAGTFYWDGVSALYVHMFDHRTPDPDNGWIYNEVRGAYVIKQTGTTSACTILLENLEFMTNTSSAGSSGIFYRPTTSGSANSVLFGAKNVLSYGASGNGIGVDDADIAVLESCHTGYNRADGLNYHSLVTTGTKGEFITVYEHNCTSKYSGFDGFLTQGTLGTSSNGSTAHDSIHVLRTNGYYGECNGAVIADVNGVLSVNLNCHAGHPGSGASPKALFWHDNYLAAGSNQGMYLWGCSGHDDGDTATNILDQTAQGGGATGQIYVKYWRGQHDGALYGGSSTAAPKDWAGNKL